MTRSQRWTTKAVTSMGGHRSGEVKGVGDTGGGPTHGKARTAYAPREAGSAVRAVLRATPVVAHDGEEATKPQAPAAPRTSAGEDEKGTHRTRRSR